jgi:5-methylcytosine-specific restriction endonuclease McrA
MSARDRNRRYRERHRERANASSRAWYAANKEQHREAVQRWRDENPEKARESSRAAVARYGRAHREVLRERDRRRRAREHEAFVESVEELVLLELDDGVCGICGEDVDPFNFEVDHIYPLSRGGFHNYENTQPAHPLCNRKKKDRLPEEACT